MANAFYNRGASFNPDELADGDAIEAEFDAVGRGFDTIEDLVININKAGYPTQTFHVAPATEPTHAAQKAQLDDGLALKLDAADYNAPDVLTKLKTVDGHTSGLDADLLDGQEGSYYRNASNINAGTLAKERLPASIDADTLGNAATATSLKTAVTINSVTFSGLSNITIEPYVEQDNTSNATRYLTFVDSSSESYQRMNIDTSLAYNPSTNVLGATISGNAGTATKLATARSITLTGGVTGTATFDGSESITIATTHAATSSAASANNSNPTFIQYLTFDAYGHVTATSSASVVTAQGEAGAGAVGTYAFLQQSASVNLDLAFGSTIAGSNLLPASIYKTSGEMVGRGTPPAGTWRCMGYSNGNDAGSPVDAATLWLRIS